MSIETTNKNNFSMGTHDQFAFYILKELLWELFGGKVWAKTIKCRYFQVMIDAQSISDRESVTSFHS